MKKIEGPGGFWDQKLQGAFGIKNYNCSGNWQVRVGIKITLYYWPKESKNARYYRGVLRKKSNFGWEGRRGVVRGS